MPAPGAPFSSSELRRRREMLEGALSGAGAQHALLYGANRSGGAVPWLTGWPVSREAHVLVTPGHPDVLLVNFFNHVPEAARRAARADVRWAGEVPTDTVADVLRERGARGDTLAVVGALPYAQYAALAAAWRLVDLNRAYARLRLVKSPEETRH